jgi:hypothetical protein
MRFMPSICPPFAEDGRASHSVGITFSDPHGETTTVTTNGAGVITANFEGKSVSSPTSVLPDAERGIHGRGRLALRFAQALTSFIGT